MPSGILSVDTSFPQLTDQQTTDQKFKVITDFLYMLMEQLRYSMANMGISNFNDAELENLANLITEPVYIQLKDVEGNVSSLAVTAEQLVSRMTDAEGNISVLQQTSTAMTSQISDLSGNVSSLQQTAQSLTTRITDAEGNISSLSQTVNGFSLSVSNGSTSSTIRLMSGGAVISSQNIQMNGLVTFTGLSNGTTKINGACLATGTVIADVEVKGSKFSNTAGSAYLEVGGTNYGDMTLYGQGGNRVFRVYDQVGSVSLSGYGVEFLRVTQIGEMVYPKGNWDFSGADVSGLHATFA